VATIDAEITDRLIAHLRDDTTDLGEADLLVPISNFVDPRRAATERALMRTLPLVAGLGSEIAEPGSYLTRTILGVPLILTRRQDGSVSCLVNMCRHRGGQVESRPCGTKRFFACAYHGWTYGAETGELVKVPYEHFFGSVDKSENGLSSLPVQERHGLLWVTLSGEGRPIDDYLGPEVGRQLELCDLERSTAIFMEHSIPLEMNWKLVLDGSIDILHPKFLHPAGVGKLIETQTSIWLDYGRHGQNFSPRRKMTELAKAGGEIEAASSYIGSNLFIYPNVNVIAAPDHIEFWTVWPDLRDPARSVVQLRFLIAPEKLDERMAARLTRSWEILEQAARDEDWPMAAGIQRNALARPEGHFRYGRNEQSCAHMHRRLGEDLGRL
jgi:phenylpropionate dioxygenase-like ring-hydroxylating dioxygenase large terminal subunit